MGDLASSMGFMLTTGAPPHHSQEGHTLDQLMQSKLIMFWGCNFAETSTVDMHFYLDAKKNGAKLIVIDPRYSPMAAKADQYIQIRPATDAALSYGMIQHIIANRLHDEDYIRANTSAPFLIRDDNKKHATDSNGNLYIVVDGKAVPVKAGAVLPSNAELLPGNVSVTLDGSKVTCKTVFQIFTNKMNNDYTPEKAAKICEVPEAVIKSLAENYAAAKPAATYISQGTQRYYNGHLSFRAVLILGAVCGNIGKASAGVSWTGGTLFKAIFSNPPEWSSPVKFANPDQPDVKKGSYAISMCEIFDIMKSNKPYPIKSLWITSYGIGTQAPERIRWIKEVFPKLDLIVVSENMMTDGALYADYILPVTSFYEQEADIVGSWMNLYLQYRKPAIKPMYECKDDVVIFSELAKRMKLHGNWDMTPEQHCDFILNTYKTTKGPFTNDAFINMDIQRLKHDGVVRIAYPVDYVPFSDQKFATQTGKFELYSESMLPFGQEIPLFMEPLEGKHNPLAKRYPLVMMNTHSRYSAHSTHRPLSMIMEMDPEPRLHINDKDAADRNLKDGDLAEVFNERGSFTVKVLVNPAIKQGVLNVYEGWWPSQFPGKTHYADLLHITANPAQKALLDTNYSPYDNLVQVKKTGGKA
jgi:molybdopterin-containing oxidoreductase family molybdopterin binding subunit